MLVGVTDGTRIVLLYGGGGKSGTKVGPGSAEGSGATCRPRDWTTMDTATPEGTKLEVPVGEGINGAP